MVEVLYTDRLRLRDWSATDAQAALKIYGHDDVSRWLHTVERIPDEATMHRVLQRWDAERSDMTPGTGRWAVTLRDSGTLVGGISLLPMPVPEADVEIGYQLAREYWGRGYITEAAWALARWAFQHSLVELFALVDPENSRAAATARRIGMEWVGESGKYHGTHLQVFRLRPDDLTRACQK
ncbi:MAG: hypothetical protein QOH09_3312 [Pseudonocardiales bacterium]|jgi:RimJ/RimL family protein N-acetyltransferase|nr:acetyltransferase [Pseudonocardiales bacterium]MDT7717320.1 hypothetical protein [Pseudonocardiales bacterium]